MTSWGSSSVSKRPVRRVHVAKMRATFLEDQQGIVYVRSPQPLGFYPARITDRLEFWAKQAPDRIFLAQREVRGGWQTSTYGSAWERVRRLASGLIRVGLSSTRPLLILSGNSIEHGLLALAAMYAGVPYAPIAPSYSLMVREFKALEHVWQNLNPGMVFMQDGSRFTDAIKAVMREKIAVVHYGSSPEGIASVELTELEREGVSRRAEQAHQATGPDSIAKILYTSTPGTSNAAPYEVDFNYVTRVGGDSITQYVAGGLVSRTMQLDNVNVLSSGTTVRKYQLGYQASATTNRPML